ncbi:MAG: hypothetical protein ACRENP_19660 [Longimicrobiales bacterium]
MTTRIVAASALLLVAACATASPGSTSTVDIVIENNLIPPGTVTIYLVPRGGIERLLGTVTSSGRRSLQYRGLPPVGEHRLFARTISGQTISSNTFVMDGVLALEWSLASNFVRITETRMNRMNRDEPDEPGPPDEAG